MLYLYLKNKFGNLIDKRIMATIDREAIFQLVNKQCWQKLVEVFKDNSNYSFIANDTILKPLIDKYFIDELLTNSSMANDPDYKYYLQNFFMLHEHKNYLFKLGEENYKKLIIRIVEVEEDLGQAYNYALKFPEERICKQVIGEFKESLPNIVQHSQGDEIYVTENKNIVNVDASIGLFKSNQEYQFYKAVRECYPMFLVIPNVAINAVLNFDLIKDKLTQEEKNYFFRALIDCVVIDTENQYKPIQFFELDSVYHDSEQQHQKDKLKDNILAVGGQKLLRIRRVTVKQDESDFVRLIREKVLSVNNV